MVQPTITLPIASQFGAHTTSLKAVQGISLKGRHAIVTGSASGLSLETSHAMVAAGAALTLAVRNLEQGRAEYVGADVTVSLLDSSDLATVPQLKGHGGLYPEDCKQGLSTIQGDMVLDFVPHIADTAVAQRLWTVSEAMLATV